MADAVRILVVEDHFATLDGLIAGLSREPGFEVVGGCANSDEGLELADKLRPDIIVLDVHLPGSHTPTTMIQEYLRIPDAKLVIFSAEMRLAYVQSVLSMGVSAYLLKSERVAKVAETIRLVVSGKKAITSEQVTQDNKKITPSEQEILHMLGKGMKYQEIADQRFTSIATARKQCEVLQLKLGLENREQLIAWSVQNGYGSKDFNK
ncbi:MAG TPA: response regulator transcription factor [Trichormus sp.]|jgi:DNA-binding NarL/FixJ family response regulator